MAVLSLLLTLGGVGGFYYLKWTLLKDTPNTLTFQGDLQPVPFQWVEEKSEDYIEPHSAILIPVSVPGVSANLFMQFDTGSPNTFLRSGALQEFRDKGISFELFKKGKRTCVESFELDVAGNQVLLEGGWVRGRKARIDWDNPAAINIIGSFGADLIDQKVCEIDFPAKCIRLSRTRSKELASAGVFSPFQYDGRRILLPAAIDGSEVTLFYDSGCSAFGLLTSKYHFDRLTDPNEDEVAYGATRFGDSIPIHHKPTDHQVQLGETTIPLARVSYAEMYTALQATVGRAVGGGFFGNKSLVDCTLVLDARAKEFLVVNRSLAPTPVRIQQADVAEKTASEAQAIPFRLTRWNNMVVSAIVNNKDAVDLMFHTAADDVSLTLEALKGLPDMEFDKAANAESWGGDSKINFATGVAVSFGPVVLKDAAVFQSKRSGHETDGKFGPRQLGSKYIEIDFDRSQIRLHSALPAVEGWEPVEIVVEEGMMFMEGTIHVDEKPIQHRFMIHSGYSGFALLDDDFVAEHKSIDELKVIEESELTDSGGHKIKTKKSSLPKFSIGSFEFDNVPVSYFGGSIGGQKFSVVGGDFLKRFNLVFDLEGNTLYLMKSSSFDAEHF